MTRDRKAWTASNANPWSVQAELCAFAAWSPAEWSNHPVMLENCAAWIAEEAAHFGIPLVALSAGDAQNPGVAGVCQHADLGAMGGGHWDCGPGFPMGDVLDMARTGGRPAEPEPEPEEADMFVFLAAGETGPMPMCGGKVFPILDGTDTERLCVKCDQTQPLEISAATWAAWR